MRPQIFDFQLAPRRFVSDLRLRQREQLHACSEASRNVAVHFRSDFAVPALRLHDTGQGNELAAGFRTQCRRSPSAAKAA